MKYVAFDLETTGTDAETDRIVEFCFIELDADLNELGRWSSLVNPEMAMSKEVVEIHGITDEMVADKATFATHAGRIQRLTSDAVLIAHNHRFDVSFLHNELVRAGQPGLAVEHPCIDTLQIERQVNSHRLGHMYERYTGESLEGLHRSEADTAATVEVLRRQRTTHADKLPPTLDEMKVKQLVRHFDPEAQIRTWLDHGHKFYEADGKPCFGFGKFRDAVIDIQNPEHKSYLLWMRDRDFPADSKAVVAKLLGPEYQSSVA